MSKYEDINPNENNLECLNYIENETPLTKGSQPPIIIKVCMGSSCFVRGNAENLTYIEKFIENSNLEAKVELIGHRCDNNCSTGPHIMINDKSYDNVDLELLKKTLLELTLIRK